MWKCILNEIKNKNLTFYCFVGHPNLLAVTACDFQAKTGISHCHLYIKS